MTRLILATLALLALAGPGWAACPAVKRSAAVVRQFKRTHICPSTQAYSQKCVGHIVDHIIPRCLDGPDTVANMQYQSIADAKAKDRWERAACKAQPRPCPHVGD